MVATCRRLPIGSLPHHYTPEREKEGTDEHGGGKWTTDCQKIYEVEKGEGNVKHVRHRRRRHATQRQDRGERAESDFGQDKVSAVLALVSCNYRGLSFDFCPKGSGCYCAARSLLAPSPLPESWMFEMRHRGTHEGTLSWRQERGTRVCVDRAVCAPSV